MKKANMKNQISILAFFLITCFQSTQAQDSWTQGKKGIYSAGLGGTQVVRLFKGTVLSPINKASTLNLGMALNFSGEYKAWEYLGVGFQTGLDFVWPYGIGSLAGSSSNLGIGIPISAKLNVHIMDAANASISDKLDVYAGINIGGGPMFYTSGLATTGFLIIGPQVGARYWFDKVAIFGEFGYGATFANVGVTF